MAVKKQFNIRLDAELRARVERIIEESKGQYRSLAHYIELAVAEKVEKEGKNNGTNLSSYDAGISNS